MIRHHGGHKVRKGTYWNLAQGSRIDMENEGVLPGDDTSTYLKLPSSVMLLLGPVLGLLFVVSLPFIAVASVVSMVVGKLLRGIINLGSRIIYFEWRPTEAYLTGKRNKAKEKKKADDSSESDKRVNEE